MDDKQKQIESLLDRIDKLPKELRDAIFAETTADKVFEIAKKYDLLVDKTGEMASEIGLLMLGVTHPNDFINNLAERMKIPKDEARKIADDINASIFAPVREHLRALYGLPNTDASPEPEAQTSTPTQPNPPQPPSDIFTQKLKEAHREEHTEMRVGEQDAALEDLKAELKKVLEEHISRTPAPLPSAPPQPPPRPTYRGRDPYRELPTDETETPAVQPPPTHPFPKSVVPSREKELVFGGAQQAPANIPVPAYGMRRKIDESWQSANLAEKAPKAPEPPADVPAYDGKLPGFRGFKMQQQPPVGNPPRETQGSNTQGDAYREPIN